jgi:hypothetical protein
VGVPVDLNFGRHATGEVTFEWCEATLPEEGTWVCTGVGGVWVCV